MIVTCDVLDAPKFVFRALARCLTGLPLMGFLL